MHLEIEKFFNGVPQKSTCLEMEKFHKFNLDHIVARGITPYRTEWRIAAPDLGLAGSIDFVGKDNEGNYIIMDWKRSKNLSKASFGLRNARYVLI
jgi:RecB family endonuclease NucS